MSTELSTYQRRYVAKKALFSFLGNTFRIFDSQGSLQFFIKQKAFKLKEEINVFADEGQKEPRLQIAARKWGDFNGVYDIKDATTGEVVGAAKRHGLKSLFKDEWSILDADENTIGTIEEASGCLFILSKFFKVIPRTYEIKLGDQKVGTFQQQFNPFTLAYDVEFTDDRLDSRLGVGLCVLILAIEGARDKAR